MDENQAQFTEKVYLHVDRSLYNSGEDIWFKAYVIDASTNELSLNTNNLHVDLISPDSKIIQSRTIRIEAGAGKGDFHLVDYMPSGHYKIRAYTNFMRNFDDRLFFIKEITILNPLDKGLQADRTTQMPESKIDITFFPEGGSLIDNVESYVAFKAVDDQGKGRNITGEVYSSSGGIITTFKSTHLGMGYFTLKPVPGLSYYALVSNMDGSSARSGLPECFPTGVAISTLATVDHQLFITISTNEKTLPSLAGRNLSLSCSLPNLFSRVTTIRITSLENNFLLPTADFPDGVIRVTLSEVEGLPLCERLIYLQKKSDVQLKISTDKLDYKPREKAIVTVSLSRGSSFSDSGSFSLSAAEASYTDNASSYPSSIASWFLLESDVKGPIEEPSYYFDPSNKNRLEDLDLLLMTQGWRDFQWKYLSDFPFYHEIGFRIKGRVKRIIGEKPVEGAKINLGIFQNKSSQYQSTVTDSAGSYIFDVVDITGDADVFVSATGKKERIEGRIFVDSIIYNPPEPGETEATLPGLYLPLDKYSGFRQEAAIKLAARNKYKLSDTIDIGEVIVTAIRPETLQEQKVKESRHFYGSTDKELIVTPSMENFAGDAFDMMSGRIPGIHVDRSGNEIQVFIRNQRDSEGRGALLMLDGMEVDNMDFIQSLPVSMIDRIDVLNASPAYGVRGANGVVNIITRSGMRRNSPILTPNVALFKMSGFDAPRIFYSPKHVRPRSPVDLPDTRTTIFWEPDVKIDQMNNATIEYFNADNPTTISVTVEGITAEGIPVSGKARYDVK